MNEQIKDLETDIQMLKSNIQALLNEWNSKYPDVHINSINVELNQLGLNRINNNYLRQWYTNTITFGL